MMKSPLKIEISISQPHVGGIYHGSHIVSGVSRQERLERASAWINNAIMLFGGHRIEILVSPSYRYTLRHILMRKYPQVIDIPYDYYGVKPSIVFKPLQKVDNELVSIHSLATRVPHLRDIPTGLSCGINIGQSDLKILLIDQGKIVPGSKYYSSTWPRSKVKDVKELIFRISSIIQKLCNDRGYQVSALTGIGISIGGIIRNEKVMTRSGVALEMSEKDFPRFSQIGRELEYLFQIPCLVEQDAISKAFAASVIQSLTSCLVIDIGTSTGGAFIDREGNIPEQLGQLGRVVIDTSSQAVERPDGKGRGCLSQYLSVTGLMRVAKKYGMNIEDPMEFEKQVNWTEMTYNVLGKFVGFLFDCLLVCRTLCNFTTVLLTGGVLSGRLGDYLMVLIKERSNQLSELADIQYFKSQEPRYDSCIGVALLVQQNAVY